MIRARVDAFDFLNITPEGISWEFGGSWTRVGMHSGTYPTIINNVCWWPHWKDKKTTSLLLATELWPSEPAKLKVQESKTDRGTVTPESSTASKVTLKFADVGNGSSEVSCILTLPQVTQTNRKFDAVFLPDETESQAIAQTPAKTPAAPPAKAPPAANVSNPPTRARPSEPFFITVTSAPRDPNFKPSAAPADLNVIERPDYQNHPKALVKSMTSVTSMMVTRNDDGSLVGETNDIIAIVNPDSRGKETASIGILRADGDTSMRTALDEAVRAIRMRYPIWEPGQLDLSFGDKEFRHGGGSAGTAFALLMLSSLEGFDLDSKCAVTGDITVDWKVRKVGGITAKVRGAALDKCLYAAIPEPNESAIADLALLHGNSALYEIQIFSIATLQEANALARKDRSAKLIEAIKLFGDLQPELTKLEKLTLQKAETKSTLKKIVELAPNHLSAKYLLDIAEGKASKTLSARATLFQLNTMMHPYVSAFAAKRINRVTIPQLVTNNARKQLNTLRPMAHKDLLPLLNDQSAFIEAMEQFVSNPSIATVKSMQDRFSTLVARSDELDNDKGVGGTLRRDGY